MALNIILKVINKYFTLLIIYVLLHSIFYKVVWIIYAFIVYTEYIYLKYIIIVDIKQ